MFTRKIFAENIKLLRKAHNLTIVELSDIFETISKTTIGSWEKETNIPSLDTLDKIINLFAVSSDWLLGYSSDPYNKEVISNIENILFSQAIENNGVEIPLLRKVSWMTEEYWNLELRDKTYSLPIRANIIFLLHIYIKDRRSLCENQFKREASSALLNKLLDKKHELQVNTAAYQKKQIQQEFYLKLLQELVSSKGSAKPFFDIQAQKTTEE